MNFRSFFAALLVVGLSATIATAGIRCDETKKASNTTSATQTTDGSEKKASVTQAANGGDENCTEAKAVNMAKKDNSSCHVKKVNKISTTNSATPEAKTAAGTTTTVESASTTNAETDKLPVTPNNQK